MGRHVGLVLAMIVSGLLGISLIYATILVPLAIIRSLPDHVMLIGGDYWALYGNLSLLGYWLFAGLLVLILVGFLANMGKLSALGSVTLLLPSFAYFICTMFLMGITIMLVLWIPLIDNQFLLLRMGEIVCVPFLALSSQLEPWEIGGIPFEHSPLIGFILVGIGAFIFMLGALTWLYGRTKGLEITDFWIYRYSRHPQYLGFLIWSYGLLLIVSLVSFPAFPLGGLRLPPPSLPWILSILTMVGVALREETKMTKKHGSKYMEYRRRTPFMAPLPRKLSSLITSPARRLLGKESPDSGKVIALAATIYALILVLLSLPLILL